MKLLPCDDSIRLLKPIENFGIIGDYFTKNNFFKTLKTLAKKDVIILITGETGTGKELIARAIHQESNRTGNLVTVNCTAIPKDLFESELFGHKKGAFTNATANNIGKIRSAEKGTIFFDEIGDTDINLQPKLLRFLQNREIECVGSNTTQTVDVRIIAATNKKLAEEIDKGKFREDLYYRLAHFVIHLSPLRERKYDIETLIYYFLHKSSEKHGVNIGDIGKHLSKELAKSLTERNWPGNIRELESYVEKYLILNENEIDLNNQKNSKSDDRQEIPNLKNEIMLLEKEILQKAFIRFNGNKTQMSRAVGLSIPAILYKLKMYNIP